MVFFVLVFYLLGIDVFERYVFTNVCHFFFINSKCNVLFLSLKKKKTSCRRLIRGFAYKVKNNVQLYKYD